MICKPDVKVLRQQIAVEDVEVAASPPHEALVPQPEHQAVAMADQKRALRGLGNDPAHLPVQPVTTMQIYWGAVPFVVIQIIMVGLVIAFPALVTGGLDKDVKVDLNKAATQLEQMSPDAMPGGAADPLKPGALPGAAGDSKAAEQEQQNIDDLFKDANKK